MFCPKDFIETEEGLVFAVVDSETEQEKVLAFLRYVKQPTGWKKLATQQANMLLAEKFQEYLHYSTAKDAYLHAIAKPKIFKHHNPPARLRELLGKASDDPVIKDLQQLCKLFTQEGLDIDSMGVTGSLLIGAQNSQSDIDLVLYDRDQFHKARKATEKLIRKNLLQALNASDWEQAFDKRACHLAYDDYIWHELRKYNKGMVNQRKFDISFADRTVKAESQYRKLGKVQLTLKVIDDFHGFDFPAAFKTDHPEILEVVSYTATYTGQAKTGELIEVAGHLEESADGVKRIVVGSDREAAGEYIKVIR